MSKASIGFEIPIRHLFQGEMIWKGIIYTLLMSLAKCLTGIWISHSPSIFTFIHNPQYQIREIYPSRPSKTDSTVLSPNDAIHHVATHKESNPVYPGLLLGMAMTTRGEIGFLIAAVAQSASVISPEKVHLVIIWGILLCTLMGPIVVGIIVRRIKKVGREQVLGKWGEVQAEKVGERDG